MAPLVSAATQLWGMPLKVKVPFVFSVSGKTMPAGDYTLSEQGGSKNVLVIRDFEQKTAAGALTQAVTGKGAAQKSRLEFRRYGTQYFQANVWIAGQNEGLEFMRTAAERRAADELKNIAGRQAQPELVVVKMTAAE